MTRFYHLLAYAYLTVSTTACATITQGSREGLEINSVPPGALALTDIRSTSAKAIDGYLGCEPTPCAISVSRKRNPTVTISLDGYQPIKFKATSAVATSSASVPAGSLVAGLPPGSHVVAGEPSFLKRIPVGGRIIVGGFFTMGAGSVLDVVSGANKNISPNPVTAYLSPITDETQIENQDQESSP